jgi:hypothetical protein
MPLQQIIPHIGRDDILIIYQSTEIYLTHLSGDFIANMDKLAEVGVILCASLVMA